MKKVDLLISEYNLIVSKISKLAESKMTSGDILSKLSEIEDSYIQSCIITNPNTPSMILEKMLGIYIGIGGVDEEIRIHIVSNSALDIQILEKIVKDDPSERVRKIASEYFLRRKNGRTVGDP